jgi:hypothetical protein
MKRPLIMAVLLGVAAVGVGQVAAKKIMVHDQPAGSQVVEGNAPPEFEYPPYHQVPPGKEISFGIHVIDQDDDTVIVDLLDKPASADFDPITLTVRWKPTAKDAPAGHFRVKATEVQRVGGARRAYQWDFSIAVQNGASATVEPQPLGPAVEELITIHDPERLAAVNKDWTLLKVLDLVRKLEYAKQKKEEVKDVEAKDLYAGALTAIATIHGNDRADPTSKNFDKKEFGDPAAWKIVAIRPRLDKAAQELRIVFLDTKAAEPMYLMFRFRLVKDLPPGELPPEALDFSNKEFTRLVYEAFFTGDDLNPKFATNKALHAKAVDEFVTKVLTYKSDKFPVMGTELMAIPHEARFGGGTARSASGGYASGDGWAWGVIKPKWVPSGTDKAATLRMLTLGSVPIPGFTTAIRPNADKTKWTTVCGQKFDPDDAKHQPGWEVLCRKKQGFTDLPAMDANGKVTSGALDATNLYLDYKNNDEIASVDLRDPRRDNFEENGMTCSQCHVRDFGNGDLRDAGVRDPKAKTPKASPPLGTTFFNIVPEESWRPFTLEFQQLQECMFRDAIRRYQGVETKLTCPLVAE